MKEKIILWVIKTFFREEIINMIDLKYANQVDEALDNNDISEFDLNLFHYMKEHDNMFWAYSEVMSTSDSMVKYYDKEEPECLKEKLKRLDNIYEWENETYKNYLQLLNYAENM